MELNRLESYALAFENALGIPFGESRAQQNPTTLKRISIRNRLYIENLEIAPLPIDQILTDTEKASRLVSTFDRDFQTNFPVPLNLREQTILGLVYGFMYNRVFNLRDASIGANLSYTITANSHVQALEKIAGYFDSKFEIHIESFAASIDLPEPKVRPPEWQKFFATPTPEQIANNKFRLARIEALRNFIVNF